VGDPAILGVVRWANKARACAGSRGR
jgi:hypothetical protein